MPIFRYSGYRADGSAATGTVEAEGQRDAAAKLKELGLYPKDIRADKKPRLWRTDPAALPLITRQLSTLIAAGVPLVEALRSVSEEAGPRWRAVLVGIRESVSGGSTLQRAMAEGGGAKVFPEFYLSMVAAGEASGTLDSALRGLADYLEKQSASAARVRSAMIYPAVMTGVAFVVMAFIFTFVIPKVVRVFENTGSTLPAPTKALIFLSGVFLNYWWLMLAAAALAVMGVKRLKRSQPVLVDRLLLKIPGGILQSLYYMRFSRTLGFLLEGGLPMLGSLELSAAAMGNAALRQRVREAAAAVAEGAALSSSLKGFPPVLVRLIATGEKGGRLVETLKRAADSYEGDFSRKLDRALALLEPAMILLMGLAVGFIVFSVMLPIFELNQIIN